MGKSAYVQSVFDFAIREINALEGRIVTAEDDADGMLWDQAEQVVAQLDAGLSQRALAAQWINARTGKPYDKSHVGFVKQTWLASVLANPRPRFRDAYNAIAHSTSNKVTRLVHQTGNTEWYTPPEYIAAARAVMDGIDLDPATSETANSIVQAERIFTADTDGLTSPWIDADTGSCGRVWLNPPYAHPEIERYTDKLVTHVLAGQIEAAVMLVNNATETQWFERLARVADAFCFLTGRVKFLTPDLVAADSPLQGQVILYFGPDVATFCRTFQPLGCLAVRPD